jgi:hypothetical protein
MKKRILSLLVIVLLLCQYSHAQYKKASFLNKSGRIYEIGSAYHLGNDELGSAPGLFVSFGKENSEKRVHHWYDMGLILPYDYKFTVPSNFINIPTAVVSGKSGTGYFLRYNFGVFLLKNSRDRDNKVMPYLKLSLGYAGQSSPNEMYTTTPEQANPLKVPSFRNDGFTYGGGAGILYRVNNKIGIRLAGDYDAIAVTSIDNPDWYIPLLANHASISLAVRFHMNRDKD